MGRKKARRGVQDEPDTPHGTAWFLVAIAVVAVVVAAFVWFGRESIRGSAVFGVAQSAVRAKYGAAGEAPDVRLFAPFKFSEGESSGRASFTLARGDRCYRIDARKEGGQWLAAVQGEAAC